MSSDFSHLNRHGHAAMVDVTHKSTTHRVAFTACTVRNITKSLPALRKAGTDGPVLCGARMAGIAAAKSTAQLIPLCHPLPLTDLAVSFVFNDFDIEVRAMVETVGQTGVEMEALTACAAAALTILSAVRDADPLASMDDLTLWEKRGGRSGTWRRETSGSVINERSDS